MGRFLFNSGYYNYREMLVMFWCSISQSPVFSQNLFCLSHIHLWMHRRYYRPPQTTKSHFTSKNPPTLGVYDQEKSYLSADLIKSYIIRMYSWLHNGEQWAWNSIILRRRWCRHIITRIRPPPNKYIVYSTLHGASEAELSSLFADSVIVSPLRHLAHQTVVCYHPATLCETS